MIVGSPERRRTLGGWTFLGKTWSGTFGGYGVLPKRKLISVAFGWFVPDEKRIEGFNWVTVNAFKL